MVKQISMYAKAHGYTKECIYMLCMYISKSTRGFHPLIKKKELSFIQRNTWILEIKKEEFYSSILFGIFVYNLGDV